MIHIPVGTKKVVPLLFGILITALGFSLSGCNDEPPVEKPAIVHDNSYEIDVASSQLNDGRVFITTTRDFYVSSRLFKKSIVVDTLPALGTEVVHIDADDNDGNGKDTTIAKQYDVYTILR